MQSMKVWRQPESGVMVRNTYEQLMRVNGLLEDMCWIIYPGKLDSGPVLRH